MVDRTRFERRLDEAEKSLMLWLAIRVVASQANATEQAAADALDRFAAEGEAIFDVDAYDARLIIGGNSIVHCERDWLAFHAHADEWESQDSPS